MDVTKSMVERAKLNGACPDGIPETGTCLVNLTHDQLIFADSIDLLLPEEDTARRKGLVPF